MTNTSRRTQEPPRRGSKLAALSEDAYQQMLAGSQQQSPEPAETQASGPPPASAKVTNAGSTVDATAPEAPTEQFAHSPDNPRRAREYDPEQDAKTAALAADVDEAGILQPVIVTSLEAWLEHFPEHATEFDPQVRWVVVIGNRRLAVARHNKQPNLTFIRNDRLASSRAIASESRIRENYQRVPLDPILEALEMRKVMSETGETVRAFAKRMAISHTQVNERLRLLDKLIPEFQALVSDDELSVQRALKICRLAPEDQARLFELGPPYSPAQLKAPEHAVDDGKTLSAGVTLRRGSTPETVATVLKEKVPADLLAEVLQLLTTDTEPTEA